MSKPDSNAPSNMLPWVRTTDSDITSLQRELETVRVQLSKVGINVDTQLNSALSDAFDFEQQSQSTYITKSRGMEFDGIVKANAGIVSKSSLSVGDAAKVIYDSAGNPLSDGFANFEVIPGVSGINPGTGEQYFQPGTIVMSDSTLRANVNGTLTGEGLDISLMSATELPPVRTDILDITSDGEYATYTIDGTGTNPAEFVIGAFVTIEGVDPVGYDLINVPIWDARDDGATMVFTVACTELGPYVSGGQAYVVTSRGEYESKLSVGAEDNGVTVNRTGVYVGPDSGAVDTATVSVTSTSVNAPQVDVDSAVITSTRVFVTTVEPTAISDGDIWIDPSGTPSVVAEPHTHDDRYYTETEMDALLLEKAGLDDANTFSLEQTMPTIRVTSTTDASPTSTGHAFQVGDSGNTNIRIDDNEILAVNAGSIAPLYINSEGSTVNIGNIGTTALQVTGNANSNVSVTTSGKSATPTEQSAGCYLGSSGYGIMTRTGGIPAYIHRYGASGTTSFVQFIYNGTNNGLINIASGGTPAFASGSDYRMKENITPITDAIERMKKAKAYTFNKIDSVDPSDNLHTGFIAHELAEVQPDAVIGEKDAVNEDGTPDYQQVMEAKIIPVMAQAINDLISMNEKLEARLAALEAR